MRITQIRFQNLNSLAGTWRIDFTDPAYLENSLFAITGPTGAGKSTILDAICLALYGRTPRLDKVTKSSNEIMSRHTGVCFAEVEFDTMQGSFRCHWSQHRSRKKGSGELQQPKHEIATIPTGTILESRMKDVLLKVEEVSGMDFDRFTRSTLLAQGGFAAFLQAKPDERAPLLEQITGSRIYSQISIQVHELFTLEKEKIVLLEKELDHLVLLPKEKEKELTIKLNDATKTQEKLKTAISSLRIQQIWLINIHNLQKEIQNHTVQLSDIEKEFAKQKVSLKVLPMAIAAKELEPLFLEIERIKKNQKTNKKSYADFEETKAKIIPVTESLVQVIKDHQKRLTQAEEKKKSGLKLIRRVQLLDFTIESCTKSNTEISNELFILKKETTELHKEITALNATLLKLQQSTQEIDSFFNDRRNDEELITGYLLIEKKITRLLQLRKEELKHPSEISCHQQEKDLNSLTVNLKTIQTETADVEKDLDFLQSKLQLLIRIQSLEEERDRLLTNEPCPLCGSTSHPYRTKELIEISKDERLPQLIATQAMLHSRATEWKKNKRNQEKFKNELLIKTNSLEHANRQQVILLTSIRKKEAQLSQQEKELQRSHLKRQSLFGSHDTTKQTNILESTVDNARRQLEKLQKEHVSKDRELTTIKSRLLALMDEQKRLDLSIKERERLFTATLHNSPFSSSEAFLAATLTPERITFLQNISDSFIKKQTELKGLLKDKSRRLTLELAKKLTKEDIRAIEEELIHHEQTLEYSQKISISTQEQLRQNTTVKQKYTNKLSTIESQKKVFGRWSRLHMLIGSADGKKFRNFAQGLTLEIMIGHANHHLSRMNNRYILVRDTDMPLDLNVIDTYQAGEIRSTKNLSGGESFLISLALALGLSRMASNKIRVDSLFLDEGFGSLDEEALESALDTLSSLQEANKLIGIISHVAAMKDRIPLQIEISAKTGGESFMRGPGVSIE